MKTILIILTTTILFTTFGASCVKNTPNCGALPCPTATGANVLSCNINGKPYIAKGGKPDLGGILGGCKQGCYISTNSFGNSGLVINAYFCESNRSENLIISIYDTLKITQYNLNSANKAKFYGYGYEASTNDTCIGVVTVTAFTDKFITGKFSFKGLPYSISSLNVTEGNFDIAR